MYPFCLSYAGASLAASRKLCAGATDIAINWSGGLHHAKKAEASGFCYVNDIVLAILEMLRSVTRNSLILVVLKDRNNRYHPRVMYIDIDIHHGDGVEHAFYHTNRVMTVSFHKYTGDFFPGTGKLDDNGTGLGKHFCLNVPLLDGIDDDMYMTLFKTVIDDAVTAFRPSAIVLQCGADSLGCDRLGAFNLSIAAHGECVNFVRKYNVPLLVVGGGGYTIKNVSRCWTYETSVLVGAAVPDELPVTIYDSFFRDSQWKLHPPLTGKVDNQNTAASLQRITINIRNKLRYLQGAPSVAMQEIPPDLAGWLEDEERSREEKDEEKSTAFAGERREDRTIARNEYFDGEHDVDQDEPPPTRARGSSGRRPGRPRKSRGRGRGRGVTVTADKDDKDDATEEGSSVHTSTPRGRGGRPRGRGRGRGRPPKNPDKDREKMTPLAEVQPEADTSVNVESEDESVAQNDMDVDVA
ncbi:hypothetical protein NLI96_g2741 [Meripilus lineatus]|uniref:Histone deacetylase domain-containing protein n=1 Tax=Meripilus lineatus TaxID=2056292 RepID=A0AAD5VA82_9APHY|nr:hypothetical protein NLI96_g2741 [Physisporinus lineatus]